MVVAIKIGCVVYKLNIAPVCTIPAELAQKARAEVAEVLRAGKEDRARLRVEQVVREDLLVEAMEILELLCDLLLARFGLVTSMKYDWTDVLSLHSHSLPTFLFVKPKFFI